MNGNIIQLRRQGVGQIIQGYAGLHHIEIDNYADSTRYKIKLYPTGEIIRGSASSIEIAKAEIINRLKKAQVTGGFSFSGFVEAYAFPSGLDASDDYYSEVVKNDKYLACTFYNEYSDSVRFWNNVCLIAFFDGLKEPDLRMDAWARDFYPLVDAAFAEYMKPHVQRQDPKRAKGWLAWLLSEYIRKAHPEVELKPVSSMYR